MILLLVVIIFSTYYLLVEVVCNKAMPVQQDLKARVALSLQQQQQAQALEKQYAADAAAAMMY